MRDYKDPELTVQIDPVRNQQTEYDSSYGSYASPAQNQYTVLDRSTATWTEENAPAPRLQQSLYTPEAHRLLPALLEAGDGPITVQELLEAVLQIRRSRKSRPENETVFEPTSRCEQRPRREQACFRLLDGGSSLLPAVIPVELPRGGSFTIGRFDVSVGHRQSDFEFDKRTKAVSRRHAMLERQMDGSYLLSDCGSRAGTFVDGERLYPNVPHGLRRGMRVSFGTAGADYIWEE